MLKNILKEQSSWDFLKQTELPIILYGTGDGADKVIDEFDRLGIKLSGIMASDTFVRNRVFRGFKVQKLADFEEQYTDFVIAIGFATQLNEVIDTIKQISKNHKVVVPCVPVYGNNIFNRDFIIQHSCELESTFNILSDNLSKEILTDVLLFELTGNLKYLFRSETTKQEAFDNILKLSSNESYLDLGAYRGDTIFEFLSVVRGNYKSITALEPDVKTFDKLNSFVEDKRDITALNYGIWNENTFLSFYDKGGRNNSVTDEGKNLRKVVTVDSLQSIDITTYLKADVEGCEAQMLYGGFDTLKKYKPKLNIAAYHRSEDIFKLPMIIKEINPEYKIYLRHHKYIPCWDLNLYCV